jgi:hypothetical protein
MFRDGYEIARKFTAPLILSKRTVNGKCTTSIGACVVINDEGWIVTAGHMIDQFIEMSQASAKVQSHEQQRAAIDADKTLDHKERRNRLVALGKLRADEIAGCSAYCAGLPVGTVLTQCSSLPYVDIGVAKIQPFDPAWISQYPVFKDPNKSFEPGVSLCKLGFPFYNVGEPKYDAASDTFLLPPGALPAPLFPIEGIFTRVAKIEVANVPPPPFPLLWVETSSPGLRGQSGGPTFDVKGTVWAIQCVTSHLPLGFDGSIPPQYFHVGLGVHPLTMFHFFDELKIKYTVSDY